MSPRSQHLGGRSKMIRNKGQLKVQGRSKANLAYRSLKENWVWGGGGGLGAGTNEKEEKKRPK